MPPRSRHYGITIPLPGTSLPDHKDLLHTAADLGFTDVWTSETNARDGITPLALAAAWEPRLRLGTAITPVYTRGPALLAQTVATMCEAAPGRFAIGLGSSSNVIVEQWKGMDFGRPYSRVRDTIRFLHSALAGEKVDEQYETFTVKGFRLETPPAEMPVILLAALRTRMLRLAGEEADGAILNWLAPEDAAMIVPLVGADKEIAARLFVIPSADRAQVRSIASRLIATYLNVPVYRKFHEWVGRSKLLQQMWDAWASGDRARALEVIPDEVIDSLIVWGSPEQIRARINEYIAAGITTAMPQIEGNVLNARDALTMLAPTTQVNL